MIDYKARTTTEIENAIKADKESNSALNEITTTSSASVYVNLIRVWAASLGLHESAFEQFALEVEERALEIQPGIARWYAAESLVFQFGDSLEYVDGNLIYPVIDESKRIVQLSASDKENGFLVLKVAALNGDGSARPLTNSEITAFRAYWREKKFACTPLSIISEPADIARITYRIGVDATVIDPETGQLLTNTAIYPVEDAINTFLQSYQADNFNGVFRIKDLTDVIQGVAGVINPVPEDIQIQAQGGAFSDVLANQNEEYLSRAGYIVSDQSVGFTLRDLISYYDA